MKSYLFIGDSNVNIFSGLKSQIHNMKLKKFTGISIKSIVNKENHYNEILKYVNTHYISDIFCIFGVVDVNFYYYYKKYKKGNDDIFESMKQYVREYVKIIGALKVKNKFIFGIMPSHVKKKYVKRMLVIYNTFDDTDIDKVNDDDCSANIRNLRVKILNKIIKDECIKLNIKYCDIYDMITVDNEVSDLFRLKHNPSNIHANYEYLLVVYLNTCLLKIKNEINYNALLVYLKNYFDKYLFQTLTKHHMIHEYDNLQFNEKKIIEFIEKKLIKL